jgi:hypothetical protein
MYDIDIEGFCYKGFLDIILDKFFPKNENFICAGV